MRSENKNFLIWMIIITVALWGLTREAEDTKPKTAKELQIERMLERRNRERKMARDAAKKLNTIFNYVDSYWYQLFYQKGDEMIKCIGMANNKYMDEMIEKRKLPEFLNVVSKNRLREHAPILVYRSEHLPITIIQYVER